MSMEKPVEMETQKESYTPILAAIIPFDVFGFALIFGKITHDWNTSIWFQSLAAPQFLVIMVISAAGLCLGWIRGFPRWTFPYIGLLIIFS